MIKIIEKIHIFTLKFKQLRKCMNVKDGKEFYKIKSYLQKKYELCYMKQRHKYE